MAESIESGKALATMTRSKKLNDEAKQAIADGEFWTKLGKPYGWRLIGFTYRQSALFGVGTHATVNVNSAILKALLTHRMDLWNDYDFPAS